MAFNEALAQTAQTKDFKTILSEVQQYMSNKYAAVLGSASWKQQSKSFMKKYITDYNLAAEGMTTDELVERLYSEMTEFSFLTEYLRRDDIEEINVNAWDDTKITYTDGKVLPAEGCFDSPGHAVDVIKRLLRQSGIIIDEAKPKVRGHLNNKIRITALLKPIVDETVGVSASIRIVNPKKMGKGDFIQSKTATEDMLDFITAVYRYGTSVCCTGATSSGKTTLMSMFLEAVDNNKRVFTIENGTREFDLVKRDKEGKVINNVIHTVTRVTEDEKFNIDTEELLETALTYNPDYICVAEMKGPESFAAQEAARTGHAVITTTHANSCTATYSRMATLCKMKYDINDKTLYDLVTEAFPIVLFCQKLDDNSRKITEITECVIHPDQKREIRTLWRYNITRTYMVDGESQIEGEFQKVKDMSESLQKKLRDNGMPEELLKRFLSKKTKKGANGHAVPADMFFPDDSRQLPTS